MKYPYGSVPHVDGDLVLLAKRLVCSAVNHHPRSYDGSWCWGYGYVCGRCFMYADPWSRDEAKQRARAVGADPSQEDVARIAGGGPRR